MLRELVSSVRLEPFDKLRTGLSKRILQACPELVEGLSPNGKHEQLNIECTISISFSSQKRLKNRMNIALTP
jgi:hypothetical protein